MASPAHIRKVLARHAAMVLDPLRTIPLQKAIEHIVRPGDSVCDIGCGLGLLSFFALSAGASQVFAIDCDAESLEVAVTQAKKHGLGNKIVFFEGHSSDIDFDKRVDVAICETIGSAAFDENILATLGDVKKHLLKRGGKIIPEIIELWGAPAVFRSRKAGKIIETARVAKEDLLSRPSCLVSIHTMRPFRTGIHVRKYFTVKKSGRPSGMAVWPRIEWTKGIVTDASPAKAVTHWKQCVLPVKTGFVKPSDRLNCELIIRPNLRNPKEETEVLWKLNVV
jgi:predicted RNA methylase